MAAFPDIPDTLTTDETRRDRWGRYQVVPPEGGKPTGYTRATTVAKALDDGAGLINWSQRMVALGLARRPDLVALAATTDPDDRKALDRLCDDAAKIGGSKDKANLGTAVHSMMERSFTDTTYRAPDPYAADIQAVHDTLRAAGLTVVDNMVERIVVNDRHRIAGTFDLLVTDGQRTYVADIKTGSSLTYGAVGFAVQLFIYASADCLYTQGRAADGSDDLREPLPGLDRERGVIVHIQPGTATCQLHWIDLQLGAIGLDLALAVRDIRKAKPLTELAVTASDTLDQVAAVFPGTEDVTVMDDDWRNWIRERLVTVREAGHMDAIARMWPADLPTIKSGAPINAIQADRIEQIVSKIEAEAGLQFPAPKPVVQAVAEPAVRKRRPAPADKDDREATAEQLADLNQRVTELDTEQLEWAKKVLDEAHKAGRSLKLHPPHGIPALRRYTAACAVIDAAQIADDQIAWAVIEEATGGKTAQHSLGDAFGSLRKTEAEKARQLFRQLDSLDLVANWHDNGTVTLTPNNNHGETR